MVSVCLTTYNGEKFVSKQIQSILSQISLDDEIVISDNGSIDNTLDIIKQFDDRRIKIFFQKQTVTASYWNKFYNITSNFENAINKSSGDIIILCDQDDIWDKNKIEILKKDLAIKSCVVSNYCIIDENDNIVCQKKYTINPLKNPFHVLLFPPFLGSAMAIRREFLKRCLPFPKKLILHDIYLGIIAYITNNIYFENKTLTFYRCHQNNVTTASHGKTRNKLFYVIVWRIKFYFAVFWSLLRFFLKK